jgi:hypothetical protein
MRFERKKFFWDEENKNFMLTNHTYKKPQTSQHQNKSWRIELGVGA